MANHHKVTALRSDCCVALAQQTHRALSRSERNPIRIPHTHVKRLKEEKSKLVQVSAACERLQELRSDWMEMRLCTPRLERAESAVLSLSIPEIVLIV